jgi:predicted nucleic acid-binding protein
MGEYIIDTNVISGYFSETLSETALDFLGAIIDNVPNLSVITEIEALSWINADKKKEKILREFIEDSNILSITPLVVRKCVAIRRSKKIKTPDAIIAATAIVNNLILISSDANFMGIQGLQILDPKNIVGK